MHRFIASGLVAAALACSSKDSGTGLPSGYTLVSIDGEGLPAHIGPVPPAACASTIERATITFSGSRAAFAGAMTSNTCQGGGPLAFAYTVPFVRHGQQLVFAYAPPDFSAHADTAVMTDSSLVLRAHANGSSAVNAWYFQAVR
jgi:hypothetical protein